jgi:hypothetical protein
MTWPYRTPVRWQLLFGAAQDIATCRAEPFTAAFAGIADSLSLRRVYDKELRIFNDLRFFREVRGRLARFLLNGDRAQKNAHLQIQLTLGDSP